MARERCTTVFMEVRVMLLIIDNGFSVLTNSGRVNVQELPWAPKCEQVVL